MIGLEVTLDPGIVSAVAAGPALITKIGPNFRIVSTILEAYFRIGPIGFNELFECGS